MALYRLPAIVLRTYPFSDTHLIVTLFSPTRGKVRAIAKGCRRLQSALGRVVQPMVYAQFQLAEGKNLDVVTQGVIKNAFPHLRHDLDRLSHGLYALELIDRLLEEPEPNPAVFFLLLKTLEGLEDNEHPSATLRVFEGHLLRHLGYAPDFEACMSCSAQEALNWFSIRMGGMLCNSCQSQDRQAHSIAPETLEALKLCSSVPPGKPPALSSRLIQYVAMIHQRFLEEKCGKTMHSFQLLEQVRHLDMAP